MSQSITTNSAFWISDYGPSLKSPLAIGRTNTCQSVKAAAKWKIVGASLLPQKFATAITYGLFARSENDAPADFPVQNPCQVCRPNRILSEGPVLDAPCGFGRNAVTLAMRGCTAVGAIRSEAQRTLEFIPILCSPPSLE
jgi:hypothetical protein